MPAQVIVKLIADTSGLEPGIDSMEKLGEIDKGTADQIRNTNKAFQERAKATQGAVASTDKLYEASKKLVESIAGGAISQAAKNIEEIGKESKTAAAETMLLGKTIEAAKQKLGQLSKDSPEFDKLSSEIAAAEVAIANMGDESKSSRGKLRQYRETLLQLEDAGLDGTQVFEDLAVAAGQLSDQVGDTQNRIKVLASDTFKFDVAIQAVEGVAGAFSVAQGAAALFGSENEELQKALLKVNAAMAILQGLQSIQNILQKESALSIGATVALQKLSIVQTNLQAAAESRNIIVRYAAIAAQRTLNLVMAANPAGVVLFAIAALATGIYALTRNTDDAAEAQKKLNEGLKISIDLANEYADSIGDAGDLLVAQLKAQGASEAEIRKQRISTLQKQLDEIGGIYRKAQDNYNKIIDEATKRDKLRHDAAKAFGVDAAKETKEETEARIKAYELVDEAAGKFYDIQKQLEIARLEDIKETNAEELRSAAAAADARVAATKKGSIAESQARIDAVKQRRKKELAADGLTEGERQLIIANSEREIADLRREIQEKSLDDRIALVKKEGLETRNTYIRLQRQIDTVVLQAQKDSLGKSKAQTALIEAQKNEDIKKLREQFFKDIEHIDTVGYIRLEDRYKNYSREALRQAVLTNAQIAQARLQARQEENQRQLDNIERRVADEKELRYRIKEAALTVASSVAGSLNEIAKNQSDYQLSLLQQEQDKRLEFLQKQLDQGAITQQEYNSRQLKLQDEFDRKARAIRIRSAQQEKQLALFQAGIAQSLAILSVLKDQTIPFVSKPIFIGLAIAQALAQIAAIASKPIPAFKDGTKNAPGGLSLIGEAGAELFYANGKLGYANKPMLLDLPKGAKVIPAAETSKIMNKYDIPLPRVPSYAEVSGRQERIDYDRLGAAVGKHIEKLPLTVYGYDKDGPFEHITSIQNRRQFLNKRFGRSRR